MADHAGNSELPFRAARSLPKPVERSPGGDAPRANGETVNAPLPPRLEGQPQPRSGDSAIDIGTMIVGKETAFSGKIGSCSRLVVEGRIKATLADCEHVIINESGIFTGNGSTENAEIYGVFEGRLEVRKRLLVHGSGRISGTITYGEIEVERGGRINGAVEPCDATRSKAPATRNVAMKRGRRRSTGPRHYAKPDLPEKNSGEPEAPTTPTV